MKEQNPLGGASREWEKEGTEEHVREGPGGECVECHCITLYLGEGMA
jgi:hypothetical protein